MSTQTNTRKFYLDVLRVIAMILVLVNHLPVYTTYQYTNTLPKAFIYLFITMFTRINVPLFFMISGSLLLSKDIGYKQLLTKRIPRFLAILVLASVLQYFVYYWRFGSDYTYAFGIRDFISRFFRAEVEFSYWFLYCYLAFLVMMPFLRRAAIAITRADVIYMLIIHCLLFSVLHAVNYFFDSSLYITDHFYIPFITEKAFFYPLLGFYLDQVLDIQQIKKKHLFSLLLTALLGIFIASAFSYHQGITTGYTEEFVQMFDYTTAIFVFVFIKYLFANYPQLESNAAVNSVIHWISSISIGVYLFDITLKSTYSWLYAVVGQPDDIIITGIWCVYSICICGGVTYCLKKLPVLKHIL